LPSRWSPRVPSSLGARGASRRSGDVGECAGPRPLGARALSPVVRVVRRGCLSRCEPPSHGRSRGERWGSFSEGSFGASARLSRRGDSLCRCPPRASTRRSFLSGIRPGNRCRGHTRIAVKRQGELWSLRVPPPVARRVRRCVGSKETFAVTSVPIDGCRSSFGLSLLVRSLRECPRAAIVPPRSPVRALRSHGVSAVHRGRPCGGSFSRDASAAHDCGAETLKCFIECLFAAPPTHGSCARLALRARRSSPSDASRRGSIEAVDRALLARFTERVRVAHQRTRDPTAWPNQ